MRELRNLVNTLRGRLGLYRRGKVPEITRVVSLPDEVESAISIQAGRENERRKAYHQEGWDV